MADLPRFKDSASTTLASSCEAGDTSVTVISVTSLTDTTAKPSFITLWNSSTYSSPIRDPEAETLKVTAWDTDTKVLTLGTALSYDHTSGDKISLLVSAEPINEISAKAEGVEDGATNHVSYRNESIASGIAGIYNPCRTLLNEHRPVCTMEISLYGKYLDVSDNPDVWYPLADNGSIVYSTRKLTLSTPTSGAATATRAVLNTTAYSISSNFLELTVKFQGSVTGEGGDRNTVIGFGSYLSGPPAAHRAIFIIDAWGVCYIAYNGGEIRLDACTLGRNLAAGDICTVRLDRKEGSANIDIARFYVNGTKQYETEEIPTENVYVGVGVYCDSSVTSARSLSMDYLGFKYVP